MTKIFISYRREDSVDVTGRICDRLVQRFGKQYVFKDVDSIQLGIDFRKRLVDVVSRCEVLLAVIGRQWLTVTNAGGWRRLDDPEDFVRIEIETALQRKIPVIPVLVQNTGMPPETALPAGLKELAFRHAITVHPDPDFHHDVDRLIDQLNQHISPRLPTPGESRSIAINDEVSMAFAYIPPGTFVMGSPEDELGHRDDETQHRVMLTKGYYLGIFPVTQAQWQAVVGNNPSHFKGPSRPVENVSWPDAVAFCEKLSQRIGSQITLPTEAEWEYACRAATIIPVPRSLGHWREDEVALEWRPGAFHFGDTISTDQANCDGSVPYGRGSIGKARGETTPINTFPANAWNLQDMHGNVWEWCADWYGPYLGGDVKDPKGPAAGTIRVLRGGSCLRHPDSCRAAYRGRFGPEGVVKDFGFRVCLRLG
jgi:formylglycine-generating enzyme required for sulfatase activity